ncbi:hypothetical protein WA026_006862 [Henosepilachna vigintioctopunctata]|uniref:Uncharacterized protein n=1 Tax=Henosepilachna vigintioctopunctata TaxID=420089 RepID=A0AAW1UAX4_9CUCU
MFRAILESYNLNVLNVDPTRKTSSSATCLDNIISNVKGVSAIIEEHLSDHSGQKFIFQSETCSGKPIIRKNERVFKEENHHIFNDFFRILTGLDFIISLIAI